MATFAGRYDEPMLRRVNGRLGVATGIAVRVYESDGVTVADLFTDRTKASPADNPVDVDESGNLEFFADPGTYVLSILESDAQVATNVVSVYTDPGEPSASAEHDHDADYATAAQGTLADSAMQPGDDAADLGSGAATDGYILTADGAGGAAWEVNAGGGGGGGATNLTWTAATSTVASDTGTDAVLTAVDGSNPGLMTVAQSTKLAGIETAADVTDPANVAAAGAHMAGGTDVPVADGGTGASTAAAARTNLGVYSTTETDTAIGNATSAAVQKSTFDANTILKADTDDTPVALPVPASRLVGRKATGAIAAITTAELVALAGTPDGTKFLADDGTLKTPAGGSAGVWTKIAKTRLTVATAQVDLTSLSGYTSLRLHIQGGSFTGTPAGQTGQIAARFNSVSTTTYQWVRQVGYNNAGAFAAFNSAATDATYIILGDLPMNATAGVALKTGAGIWHFDNSNIATSRTVVGSNTHQQRGFDRVFTESIGGNAEATAVISTLSILTPGGSDSFDIGTTFILEGTTE